MSSRRTKEKVNQSIKIILVSVVVLIVGYYVLNHISTRERPPLGNTFYIIVGCAMIAVSLLVILITLKKLFFPKKRRSSKGQVFLDEGLVKKTRKNG